MDKIILQVQQNFESIKQSKDDFEFWSARDLMPLLGYKEWRKFAGAIERAKDACKTSGQNTADHFVGADKPIVSGKGGTQIAQDFLLTRYACYLIM